MTRELVAGHTLVYTWRGTDLSLPPVVLMAHHDVVPVTSEHPLRPVCIISWAITISSQVA